MYASGRCELRTGEETGFPQRLLDRLDDMFASALMSEPGEQRLDLRPATFPCCDVKVQTILSDNGREYCGRPDKHPDELFLQLEEIEHRTTKVGRSQSNGFIERFHRTLLEEHLRRKGRTTWYESLEEMQPGPGRLSLRPATPAGPTAAAGWTDGRPTRSSRPGSRGSGAPGGPHPERRSRPQHRADLGEAGCQVITVLVQRNEVKYTDEGLA